MGVQIIAKDVDAEDYAVEFLSKVPRGLEGLFFMNKSRDKVARNFAPGKPNATLVGNPVVGDDIVTFESQTNFIETEIVEPLIMTAIFIARSDAQSATTSERSTWLSTLAPGAPRGFNVGPSQSSAGVFYSLESGTLGSFSAMPTFSTSTWALYSFIMSETEVRLKNITTAPGNAATVASSLRVVSGRKIRIGSDYGSYLGETDMLAARIHSVALSEAEIDAAADELRRYASRHGITV